MANEEHERLSTEVELLESMYPEQVSFNRHNQELTYILESGKLQLRMPDGYLQDTLPEILSASAGKVDLRDALKHKISHSSIGEEILDSIILSFNDAVESAIAENETYDRPAADNKGPIDNRATVVVWLHHLLNTNKRKQALSPSSAGVSGITKPGYPGVLVYSGPAQAVYEHVNELKQLNWQAFQIRLESEEEWRFKHGSGIIEVEAMKDVVAEVGEEQKQVFMEVMKIK